MQTLRLIANRRSAERAHLAALTEHMKEHASGPSLATLGGQSGYRAVTH